MTTVTGTASAGPSAIPVAPRGGRGSSDFGRLKVVPNRFQRAAYDWLRVDVLDAEGRPVQQRGGLVDLNFARSPGRGSAFAATGGAPPIFGKISTLSRSGTGGAARHG